MQALGLAKRSRGKSEAAEEERQRRASEAADVQRRAVANVFTRCSALLGLVLLEVWSSGWLGPVVYNLMQQNYMYTGTPQLLPTLGVMAYLVVAVLLTTLFASTIKRPPKWLRTMGATTLGTYIFHMRAGGSSNPRTQCAPPPSARLLSC